MTKKELLRTKRHNRIRAKVTGTADRPRLSVHRSLNHLYVQIIDDTTGKTLIGMSDKSINADGAGIARAQALGKAVAEAAKSKNITSVVFDRGGFQYHGQVKALAEGVREAGITV